MKESWKEDLKWLTVDRALSVFTVAKLLNTGQGSVRRWLSGQRPSKLNIARIKVTVANEKAGTHRPFNIIDTKIGDIDANSFGRKILGWRVRFGIRQGRMAEELEVSQSALSSWERGATLPSEFNRQLIEMWASEKALQEKAYAKGKTKVEMGYEKKASLTIKVKKHQPKEANFIEEFNSAHKSFAKAMEPAERKAAAKAAWEEAKQRSKGVLHG